MYPAVMRKREVMTLDGHVEHTNRSHDPNADSNLHRNAYNPGEARVEDTHQHLYGAWQL